MIILLSVKVTITFFFVEVTVNCTSLLVAIAAAAAIYEAADFDSGFVFVNTNELLKIDIPDQ